MSCIHHPYDNKHCVECMLAKIRSLRGPDPKTSRMTQNMMFAYMPSDIARKVKEILAKERAA